MNWHDPLVILMMPSVVLGPLGLWAVVHTYREEKSLKARKAATAAHSFKESAASEARMARVEHLIASMGETWHLRQPGVKRTYAGKVIAPIWTTHVISPQKGRLFKGNLRPHFEDDETHG